MNTIFRYALIFMGAYFAINWMADNPAKVDVFRTNVNNVVQSSSDMATKTIKDNVNLYADLALSDNDTRDNETLWGVGLSVKF